MGLQFSEAEWLLRLVCTDFVTGKLTHQAYHIIFLFYFLVLIVKLLISCKVQLSRKVLTLHKLHNQTCKVMSFRYISLDRKHLGATTAPMYRRLLERSIRGRPQNTIAMVAIKIQVIPAIENQDLLQANGTVFCNNKTLS